MDKVAFFSNHITLLMRCASVEMYGWLLASRRGAFFIRNANHFENYGGLIILYAAHGI